MAPPITCPPITGKDQGGITLRGVTLRRGGRLVLDHVELHIGAGQFIGLFGANGAGKTTLLQAILGEIPVTAGQISIAGTPPALGNPLIGSMPQLPRQLPATRLSGREVLAAAALRGPRDGFGLPWPRRAAYHAVDAALELLDAQSLARRTLSDLSGGERQRVMLAQALLFDPKILLLDEPLIGLDPRRQGDLVALVRRVQQARGLSVMFAAHELNPLLPALDQVLYLGGGKAALGSVDAVCQADVLERLYGAPIEVVRAGGRIFILGGGAELSCAGAGGHGHGHDHGHDHGHGHGHDHGHGHAAGQHGAAVPGRRAP